MGCSSTKTQPPQLGVRNQRIRHSIGPCDALRVLKMVLGGKADIAAVVVVDDISAQVTVPVKACGDVSSADPFQRLLVELHQLFRIGDFPLEDGRSRYSSGHAGLGCLR